MDHNLTTYYFIEKFDSEEILNLNTKINIILRNYNTKLNSDILVQFVSFCHKMKRRVFLSNDINKAIRYGFDGVYIPSFNKLKNFYNLSSKKNFKIIGSAHNIREIIIKRKQGCEEVFVSPIFKTYKKKYLDVVKFNLINLYNNKKVIALGGINQNNLKKLTMTKSSGFASISWIKKTGLL